MVELKMMDKSITDKYKLYKSPDGIVRSCSLSARAAKGSVVGAKKNYSAKEKELFKKFMEI